MGQKIVIVGVNHAGTACANQIRALLPDSELLLIDRNNNTSFLGCGMALWIGDQISKGDGLFYSSKEKLEEVGAKVQLETEVDKIDFAEKKIHCKNKDGEKEIGYDKLVLATGSLPVLPPIPGMDLPYVQRAKLYQDAKKAVDQIKNDSSIKKVTVVGAGYIGAELAEAYKRVGKEVVLIDSLDRILGTHFDVDFSNIMLERLRKNGIKVQLGEKVTKFEGSSRVEKVITDKGSYDTDLVIMCIGFKPNTSLAKGNLELFKNGAILVDKHQRSSRESVYAIGDCATVFDNSLQETSYIALATNAVRSGLVAAFDIAGLDVPSLGVQGSSGLCLYNLKMVCTGQSVHSAKAHGIDVKFSDFVATQKPAFMDEVGPNPKVKIRIVYRADNRIVIGAQLISEYDMSAVIHMFSLAIQEQITVDKLKLLDIFFMPHFNEPYNYITMAAISAE